jgi:hypothetical protein
MDHLDKNKILTNAQHGFRKKRSCESQLVVTIHEIASKLEKGSQLTQVDIILLDFAKAFDKVLHQRLLHKLEYYGVNAKTKNWIQSFLQNRQQRVILEGAASEQAPVLSGVPQGTVLGPLLFLTYINDMPEMVKSSETKLFADDSLLFRTINNQADSVLLQNGQSFSGLSGPILSLHTPLLVSSWMYMLLISLVWCSLLSCVE